MIIMKKQQLFDNNQLLDDDAVKDFFFWSGKKKQQINKNKNNGNGGNIIIMTKTSNYYYYWHDSKIIMMVLLPLLTIMMMIGTADGFNVAVVGGSRRRSVVTAAVGNYNNWNNEPSSSNNNQEDSSSSSSSLQLIQQWLLLHLPSLSNDDLKLYSLQLLQDGFTSVERLENVNFNVVGNTNNHSSSSSSSSTGSSTGRLEDLYFMKKGHRRVLLQKIGKIREMKGDRMNRLRLFEEEEEEEVDDGGEEEEEVGGGGGEKVEIEQGEEEEGGVSLEQQQDENERSEGDKYKPTIGSGQSSSSFDNNNDDDDDSLISLTAWENKELGEFVYNEQERDAMDDKGKRRLKEIEEYLREHRNNNEGGEAGGGDGGGDGDEYDMATFDKKELVEFVYNEQTRGVMDGKGKRRLKEIERYIQQQQHRNEVDENKAGGDEYDTTTFEQKEMEEFVYNEQTRDAMDDKSKRRVKEIEAYIKDQQRQKREREEEELKNTGNNDYEEEDEEEASLSSPSLPASWNFADLEDFVYNEQEREVMDDKGKRRLKEIEEYVQSEQNRLREDTSSRAGDGGNSNNNNNVYDEEELLDDFAARYQGIVTARDEKKTGGSVGSSSAAKEEKRHEEFLEAWLARQRKAGGDSSAYKDDEDLMDDFASRYQKLGTATADGVSGGSSEKSARRLKDLETFLRARQSRELRGRREERETPVDDFEARYQAIGSSAADAIADGRSDKSSRRLRALDAFLKSRQSRANAAAEEEALRLDLLQKPMTDLTATERKERIRVEEFQRRARIAKEKEGNRADTNVSKSGSAAAAAAKRKSNEERRLEALNKWTAKENEEVEERRIAKMLKEYQRLTKGRRKVTKNVAKQKVKEERSSTAPLPPSNEDAAIDDFFDKRRIHSMSTTLPPSNNTGRKLQQKIQSSSGSDDENCAGDECFDITRNSFSDRESKSLSTTLQPNNKNAKMNSYVPASKDKVTDFLPTRSNDSDEGFVGDKGFDISRSSYSQRESKSLSTTLPPSNKNAKQNSYVPGSTSDDENCVGDECVDITRGSFLDRESMSLSTTLPPSNENAKANSYVPGSNRSDEEDCVDDECVDITRSSFPEREQKSLSTTLPPSNENAKTNSFTPESKKQTKSEDVEPEEYFDITTRLFQERGQSLSSGYQSVFKEEDRSEMDSRAASLYAKFQSQTRTPPSRSSILPTRQVTKWSKVGDQGDLEDAYMDITQRLWDERQTSSLATPPASSFKEGEKSEMNDRKRPSKSSPRGYDEEAGSFSSLSQFVNTGTKRSFDDGGGYVDESERFTDRTSFVQSVNSGTAKRETTSGSYKDSTRSVSAPAGDYVDESERFSDRSSFVQSVNSGTAKRGMTSGSYKDRGATAPVSAESDDYVDESQRFSERSSFVQSVNTGTAKRGTTSGSFVESKKKVRPGPSSIVDDGYQDITQNPFKRNRSSFVPRKNSGTGKIATTAGSFRGIKGRSEPEEKKFFSSDRSTLMGARTWRNEDVVTNNEHEKYLSSDRSSILGPPSIRDAGRASDEHKKYISSDRSAIVGGQSIRNAGGSNEEHNKYLTSDRSSLSGAPSIRRSGASNEYLDTNQFSSKLSPSSPVKASATNILWRTNSEKASKESSIDTPPAFMKNLDMLAGGRKTIKKRNASDQYLNKNSFSQKLAPSTVTQAATVASRNYNPYLNKNGFNAIDSMRTSNASGAQFKRSHDVSPEEKERLENLDTKWAKLPDFDEMTGKSAVGENATGSRSPKRQEEEEYTMVGDFSRLERATSSVKDTITTTKSNLRDLSEIGLNDQPISGESSKTGEEDSDSEFEVMNWLLKNLPQLDEEDAVNYFVSLLEDGFDSTDMLDVVLEEDLYFMKEEHQILLMKNLSVEEDEGEEAAAEETNTTAFSESVDSMKTELEETSSWLAGKVEEVEDRRIATELTEEEMDDAEEKEPADKRRASSTTKGDDDEYTDITRANFAERASLSSATPPLFDKESSTEEDDKEPFSWQLDVRKEVTKGDDESFDDASSDSSFSDLQTESNQLFQATPPVVVELKEGTNVQESVIEERRSVKATNVDSKSQPLFQATPPLMVELKEGMTAEEAALAREERLSGESAKVDQTPLSSQITEGMTAEEAEVARSTRQTASDASPDGPSVEAPKEIQKGENMSPPRGELYQEYIARGFSTEQAQKLKDYYTTWSIGPSHEMKFTSAFTCPMSGEHFSSGIMDSGEIWGGRVWYKNKKQAMNAAAAKALDCFTFRKNDSGSSLQRCDDEPYFEDEMPTLSLPPPNVVLPTEVIQPDNT